MRPARRISVHQESDRERAAAAAATTGVRVFERKARTHHGRYVIDLDAVEIPRAEYIRLLNDTIDRPVNFAVQR